MCAHVDNRAVGVLAPYFSNIELRSIAKMVLRPPHHLHKLTLTSIIDQNSRIIGLNIDISFFDIDY